MMLGGMGGPRQLMEQENIKPQNTGATLARFGYYFRKHWIGLAVALVLIVAGAWTQVTAPELIGQSIDCYLFPQAARPAAGAAPALTSPTAAVNLDVPADGCWFDPAVRLNTPTAERLSGLGKLVGALVALLVGGALMNGIAFYAMNWSGQHALLGIRADLFRQIHRLSLGYYAKNEAGNIMSRVTSDTDTIQQVLGFALLNVLSGALLIG